MRKRSSYVASILFTSILLVMPSCKDDEPAPPAKLSFAESLVTVSEEDGIIEIELVLDKPAKEDITIEYSLDGTAIDVVTAGSQYVPDYEILNDDYLEVEIAKGETTGTIEIELFSDYFLEEDETIEIEIQSVDSDAVEITNDDDIEITVLQEDDGTIVLLDWPEPGANGDADMDLFLKAGSTFVAGSADESTSPGEFVFIPASIGNTSFGACYNYYSGTLDPLNFEVIFAEVVAGALEPEANYTKYQATYTAVNKNPWTSLSSLKVVQTFQTVGGVCSNFSGITVPSSGSRVEQMETMSFMKRGGVNSNSRSALSRILKEGRIN
ncbi:MAG TPA: hypothetical protein VFU05_03335 [Cyclobacteriaceae bacterium]|nr:hypothetical protein [Cyclobacteriaceae bacterium]